MFCALVATTLPSSLSAQNTSVEGDESTRELPEEPGCTAPCVGPPTGQLLLAGGGDLDPDIYRHFVELAGGTRARIVVIPTASRYDEFTHDWRPLDIFLEAGVTDLTILHTRDRDVADSEEFVRPLRRATAVWIMGGRTWRLVDAYLDTRTEQELHLLLARGGLVGGTSAGASIMASYLVRGAVADNDIVVSPPEYERGFGFLRVVAVDQHFLTRNRELDMLEVIGAHPELLGIGLDEGTALMVRGDRAEVIGTSGVAFYFYDPQDPDDLFHWLGPGEVYDLALRTPMSSMVTSREEDPEPH